MLKALIKKQFTEIFRFYFNDTKTGKRRSGKAAVWLIVLFALLFVTLTGSIGMMAFGIGMAMIPLGYDWLYFALMGGFSLFAGVFGSVLTTYSSLYLPKDNEFLLSLPIPAFKILLSRMVTVALLSLLYSGMVWIPSAIVYWVFKGFFAFLIPFLMTFLIALFVTALTCVLGWLVALVARKLKGKSFVIVLLSLLFIAASYSIQFVASRGFQFVLDHMDSVEAAIRNYGYPLYALGKAASGDLLFFLLVSVVLLGVFALVSFVLSKNYIKILTTSDGSKKKVYVEKAVKTRSVDAALLRRELKHFAANPAYMLNCGLGDVIIVIGLVFAIIYRGTLLTLLGSLSQTLPGLASYAPVIVLFIIYAVISMNCVTAPSISLEGRGLWILRSMPISSLSILKAKVNLHLVVNVLPALLGVVVLDILLGADVLSILISAVTIVLLVLIHAYLGLLLDVRKPNLSWNNESIPIKQGIPVMVCIFGSWAVLLVLGGSMFVASMLLDLRIYLFILMVLAAGITVLLNQTVRKKGPSLLEAL